MTYENLLNAHSMYGTKKEDIVKRLGYKDILENVVIAPWWSHHIFDSFGVEIQHDENTSKVYNVYGKNFKFTFLELKAAGAPQIIEDLLPLGLTNCKRILFIGSAGALDDVIHIGDLVIPEYSICGDGASRYLNNNLEDEFLKKEYPYGNLNGKLIKHINELNEEVTIVPNFSIDTVFAQFPHIEYIKALGAKTIEMETACFFKCCNTLKIDAAALFVISDSTIKNKSLFSGRSEEDRKHRHEVRNMIVPKIIIKLFEE